MTPRPPSLIEAARRSAAAFHACQRALGRDCHVCDLRDAMAALPPDAVVIPRQWLNNWAMSLVGVFEDNTTPAQRATLKVVIDHMLAMYHRAAADGDAAGEGTP